MSGVQLLQVRMTGNSNRKLWQPVLRLLTIALLASGLSGWASIQVRGQATDSSPEGQPVLETGATAGRIEAPASFNRLIRGMVLQQMPHQYERKRGWGDQVERWDGLHWEVDGLKIETRRRKKQVNHGTWRKYSASLADPEKEFDIRVTRIRQTSDGGLAFRVEFAARLNLFARQAEWFKGVQLYSLSAEGSAVVCLAIDMRLGIQLDPSRIPPDVVFSPRATAADLQVEDFRIDRISKLGGEFAQQVTRLARHELDAEIEDKERELVEKINKQLKKNADELRLSLAQSLDSRWGRMTRSLLPPTISGAAASPGR